MRTQNNWDKNQTDISTPSGDFKRVNIYSTINNSGSFGTSVINDIDKKIVIRSRKTDKIIIPYDVDREIVRRKNLIANRGQKKVNSMKSDE